MIATITLNPSIDQLITVNGLVKDDANRATGILRYPGGKGVNVSKAVRELGGPTHAYALVGGFSGEFWKHLLKGLDIPFTATAVKGETRVNTIVTDVRDHTQTRVSAPGPLIPERVIDGFLRKLLKIRPRPSFWVLGGSLSTGMKPDTYRKMIRALQKNGGGACVLDADDEALRLGVRAGPFMIKPNEYEIERLLGKKLRTVGGYLGAARALVKRGIRNVVVSLGAKGALFVNAREAYHVLTPRVSVKSRVGAGDCLIGGFLLGLERRMSFRQAARLGVAGSTSAVMREAPRLCLKEDIRPLLGRIRIRVL